MAKLFSLDKSLVGEIITTLDSYSERILTGGIQIKPETTRTWLATVRSLPQKSFCIGQSTTPFFEYLQCNYELSTKGFVSLETNLTLDKNIIRFIYIFRSHSMLNYKSAFASMVNHWKVSSTSFKLFVI